MYYCCILSCYIMATVDRKKHPYLVEYDTYVEEDSTKRVLILRQITSENWVSTVKAWCDHVAAGIEYQVRHSVDYFSIDQIEAIQDYTPFFIGHSNVWPLQVVEKFTQNDYLHCKLALDCERCSLEFYNYYHDERESKRTYSYLCQHSQFRPSVTLHI